MARRNYRNILVFSFTFIGDAILSTSVVAPLKHHFPEASICFLVGPAAFPLLDGDPRINQVFLYDNQGEHRSLAGKKRLIQQLRSGSFDLVVDLRDSFWSRFVTYRRWGIRNRQRDAHAVVRYLSALRNLDTGSAVPTITPTLSELEWASDRLGPSHDRPRLVIHPGGNWAYKRWQPEGFAQIGDRFVENMGAHILLLVGPGENEIATEVARQMKFSPRWLNQLSLREVAAILALSDHYVGNDTGPMHLAAAVGTPVTALFASTDHRRSGPYGHCHRVVLSPLDRGCQPCHPGKHPGGCAKGSCEVLAAITVDSVYEAIHGKLASSEAAVGFG